MGVRIPHASFSDCFSPASVVGVQFDASNLLRLFRVASVVDGDSCLL